eukprot:11183250-Lingulodinium_polyedra.AAC.1
MRTYVALATLQFALQKRARCLIHRVELRNAHAWQQCVRWRPTTTSIARARRAHVEPTSAARTRRAPRFMRVQRHARYITTRCAHALRKHVSPMLRAHVAHACS